MTRITLLLLAVLLAACASAAPAPAFQTPGDIVAALRAAGLEAENAAAMTPDDYGLAPLVGTGQRFLIPSLCSDCGGRAFVGASAEIEQLRAYYDSLAQASAAFRSWVFVTPDGRALLQINGDPPEARARAYQVVIESAN